MKNRSLYIAVFLIGILCLSLVTSIIVVKVGTVSPAEYKTFSTNMTKAWGLQEAQITSLLKSSQSQKTQGDIAQQNITTLTTSLTTVQSNINTLSSRLSNAEASLKSLQDSLAILQSSAANQASVNSLQAQIVRLTESISSYTTALNNLRSELLSVEAIIRASNITPGGQLLGPTNTTPTTLGVPNQLVGIRVQSTTDGLLSLLSVNSGSYGGVKVAIYTDNGTSPSQLIVSNGYDNLIGPGLNTIPVSQIQLTSGSWYWLFYICSTQSVGWITSSSYLIWYKTVSYTTFQFSDDLTEVTDFTVSSGQYAPLIGGWTQ